MLAVARRRFAPFAAVVALTFAAADIRTQDVASDRRPNVLVLIADDQGWADLSCSAHAADDVATPNLDRLAARGVRFTQAYATSPICNASRAGLLTGCYQQRFGTFWYGGKGLHDDAFPTFAEVIGGGAGAGGGAEGYATHYVGKFHYGSKDGPKSRSFPTNHGFDSLYGFAGGRKHYLVHEAAAEAAFRRARTRHRRRGQSLQQGGFWVGAERIDQHGFSTELLGDRARALFDEATTPRSFFTDPDDAPFVLVLGFNAVHNFTHQLPPEYLDAHGLQGGRDWDPAGEEYDDWYRRGRAPNNPEGRAWYLGQLHYLDREVGRVLDALDAHGLTDDTIVVYVGDNGGSTPIYADNGPLRGSKYTLYEGGIRVPLIVSWPGRFEAGVVRDNVVSTMDLLPTLCAAAGVTAPEHVDGVDLGPLLRGTDPTLAHETLLWDTRHETAVRHGRFKLKTAKSRRHADHEMVELELGTFLYDLEQDPGETRDLASEQPDRVAELQAVHRAWRERGYRLRSASRR